MAVQEEPHLPRLFTPGVAVLIGYVLLIGNPWLNRDLTFAVSDSETAIRLTSVLFAYPRWLVDVDSSDPFLFWLLNLRTVLFVALAVAGLNKVPRWVSAGGVGLFVTTVGLTALSAVTAGLASALVAVTLLDTRSALPFITADRPEEFFFRQFGESATFGVLFGLVLGVVVIMSSRTPANREHRVNAPKSLW